MLIPLIWMQHSHAHLLPTAQGEPFQSMQQESQGQLAALQQGKMMENSPLLQLQPPRATTRLWGPNPHGTTRLRAEGLTAQPAESKRWDHARTQREHPSPACTQPCSSACFPAQMATKQLKFSQQGSLVKSPPGIFPSWTLAPAHSHDNTAVPRGSCGMGAAKVGVPGKTQGRKLQTGAQSSVGF